MALTLRALLRTTPMLVVFLLARFFPLPADVVGENVRLGLLVFFLTSVSAIIWAVADALVEPLRRTVLTWCVTAGLYALLQPMLGWLDAGAHYSLTTARTDLFSLSVFVFGLVALPAVLAAVATNRWLVGDPAVTASPAADVVEQDSTPTEMHRHSSAAGATPRPLPLVPET